MTIQKVTLVYFSPTGTTKTVLEKIAYGFNHSFIEQIDITKPATRKRQLNFSFSIKRDSC